MREHLGAPARQRKLQSTDATLRPARNPQVRLSVGAPVTSLDDARLRSTLMAERIRLRTDHDLRQLIDEFTDPVEFRPLDALMISEQAWQFVVTSGIEPKQVFAHPVILQRHPVHHNTTAASPSCRKSEWRTSRFPLLLGRTGRGRHLSPLHRA